MALMEDRKKRQQIRTRLYREFDEGGVGISETVKSLRKILAINQPDFAKKVGISLSALRRIEQNDLRYNMTTLLKILDFFSLQLVVRRELSGDEPGNP